MLIDAGLQALSRGHARRLHAGVLDTALDRCDIALDAAAAARSSGGAGGQAGAGAALPPQPQRLARAPARHVASLQRPQDSFPDRVDNSPAPFVLPPPYGYNGAFRSGVVASCVLSQFSSRV
jgi:hypothetical protein